MSDLARLDGVHPELRAKVVQILGVMAQLNHAMIVTAGVRTAEEQHDRWLKGRNPAGQVVDRSQVVTNADGITQRSNHQVHADGFGHAVDCAFLRHGQPSWAEDHPWRCYGEIAKALGLKWGGDWASIVDRPHVELP